ncbi:hypothetical protein D917_00132 [Trichinella nativa]|uniref:Uncharacterized protein n=1 Tax=Trichinella nativa TaxID=6335 RepID=A0A1Y3EQ37_9BILA|nr:hypothetical protein D917_00132 [Trichinella nativa]
MSLSKSVNPPFDALKSSIPNTCANSAAFDRTMVPFTGRFEIRTCLVALLQVLENFHPTNWNTHAASATYHRQQYNFVFVTYHVLLYLYTVESFIPIVVVSDTQ